MTTILIVEDEVSSRDGLAELLAAHFPYVSVRTAANGVDGFREAMELHPDIIISDIRMPEKNGLEMIEEIRDAGLSPNTIFLTGFAEFEYAQKAVKLNACDYVLKPIDSRVMIEKIRALIQEIDRGRRPDKLLPSHTGRLYLVNDDDIPDFQRFLAARDYTDYFIALIYMEREEHLPDPVRDALGREESTYTVTLADRHYRGILMGFDGHRIRHSRISHFSDLLKGYDHLACIYTLKSTGQIASWIREYEMLREALPWSITYQSSFFALESEMLQPPTRSSDLSLYKKEIQKLHLDGDPARCESFIINSIHKMQKDAIPPKQILLAAAAGIAKNDDGPLYHETIDAINRAVTMNELLTSLHHYFAVIGNGAKDQGYSKLVTRAITYVHENYSRAISLSSTAEYLSITPQYLSKLFNQETSETFIDYLSNYRIDRAKALLTETNLQIGEVGVRAGYPDPKYFCTLFKKKTGISPNQFRKMNR